MKKGVLCLTLASIAAFGSIGIQPFGAGKTVPDAINGNIEVKAAEATS